MLKEENQQFVECLESIKNATLDVLGILDNDNRIFDYLKIIIENIEHENFKGHEKKELALRILRDIITESSLDQMKQTFCISLIDNGVIGNSIDIIISAASGNLEVNMTMNTAETVCSRFIIPCGKASLTAYNKNNK